MLAKITSKNQLTLPKAATQAVGATEYLEVEVRGGQIILTPVRIQRGDAVRAKLAELALTEADVADAVAWARSGAPSPVALAAEPPAVYAMPAATGRAPAKPARPKAAPAKPTTKTSPGQ
jgi:bifunctional DNA-binding transcriptional regulator/antitoxin component of YhaV-PrlF toxin-antitoxin module